MAEHTITAAGQFTVTLIHPKVNDGTPTAIDGFKLEGQMVQAQQAMDSSKVIALANGNTVTIANNNGSGSVPFTVIKTATRNDMVTIANNLKRAGDSQGGILKVTQETNGRKESTTFYACTVKNCPELIIQGTMRPNTKSYGTTESATEISRRMYVILVITYN